MHRALGGLEAVEVKERDEDTEMDREVEDEMEGVVEGGGEEEADTEGGGEEDGVTDGAGETEILSEMDDVKEFVSEIVGVTDGAYWLQLSEYITAAFGYCWQLPKGPLYVSSGVSAQVVEEPL